MQELPLKDSPMFDMALAHLEEEWPEKLERLLRAGQLQAYLEKVVDQAIQAIGLTRTRNPGLTQEEAQELVLPDFIAPRNPEYAAEKAGLLSPEAEKLLREFRESL